MRSSLGDNEDQGAEVPTVVRGSGRRARYVPDRPVDAGYSRSLTDTPTRLLTRAGTDPSLAAYVLLSSWSSSLDASGDRVHRHDGLPGPKPAVTASRGAGARAGSAQLDTRCPRAPPRPRPTAADAGSTGRSQGRPGPASRAPRRVRSVRRPPGPGQRPRPPRSGGPAPPGGWLSGQQRCRLAGKPPAGNHCVPAIPDAGDLDAGVTASWARAFAGAAHAATHFPGRQRSSTSLGCTGEGGRCLGQLLHDHVGIDPQCDRRMHAIRLRRGT